MATELAEKLPRRDSVVSGINSPEDTSHVARQFISAVRNFGSQDGYRRLAELVDRIPRLEMELQEKEKTSKSTEEAWEREKATHMAELKRHLGLYNEEYDRFREKDAKSEQQIASLEVSLTSKDKTIAEFKEKEAALKEAGRKIEETYKVLKTKSKEKDLEIAQLKKQNQESQTRIENLSAALHKSRTELSTLTGSLDQARQRNGQLDKDLNAVNAQLETISSYSVKLEDLDSGALAEQFNKIWISITLLVRKFVGEDLPDSMLQQDWNLLNAACKFVIDPSLPQSNSKIAKELRVVKVLAIIADTIDKQLLQPTYQVSDGQWPLRDILYDLARMDPERERLLRGMLLAALAEDREPAKSQLAKRVVDHVMEKHGVGEIIRPELYLEFVGTLKDILSDIQSVWRNVQYSTQVFESSFEDVLGTDFDWAGLDPQLSDVSRTSQAPKYEADNKVNVLFPGILLVGDEDIPITSSSTVQTNRINALMEEERQHPGSTEPGTSRPRQRQGRTLSMSSNVRSGQAREAFLSQTTGSNGQSNV